MKPPARQRTSLKRFEAEVRTKWTLREKEKLVQGIKRFGADDFTKLQTCVPKRSVEEVEEFINKRRSTSLYKARQADGMNSTDLISMKTPIEEWIDTVKDLLYHSNDLSFVVGNVLELCEKYEPHPLHSDPDVPDYSKLYGYIAAMLKGSEVPKLSKVEAGVMLELFQHLADRLNALTLTDQHRLMQLKHALLTRKMDMANQSVTHKLIAIALQQDPLQVERQMKEKERELDQTGAPGTNQLQTKPQPDATVTSQSQLTQPTLSAINDESSITGQPSSIATTQSQTSQQKSVSSICELQANQNLSATDCNQSQQAQQPSTHSTSHSQASQHPTATVTSQSNTSKVFVSAINRTPASEESQVSSICVSSTASSLEKTSACKKGNKQSAIITPGTPSGEQSFTALAPKVQHGPSQIRQKGTIATDFDKGGPSQEKRRANSGHSNPSTASSNDPRPKETPLFSLNPLCIPIKYLNPKPVQPLLPTWPQANTGNKKKLLTDTVTNSYRSAGEVVLSPKKRRKVATVRDQLVSQATSNTVRDHLVAQATGDAVYFPSTDMQIVKVHGPVNVQKADSIKNGNLPASNMDRVIVSSHKQDISDAMPSVDTDNFASKILTKESPSNVKKQSILVSTTNDLSNEDGRQFSIANSNAKQKVGINPSVSPTTQSSAIILPGPPGDSSCGQWEIRLEHEIITGKQQMDEMMDTGALPLVQQPPLPGHDYNVHSVVNLPSTSTNVSSTNIKIRHSAATTIDGNMTASASSSTDGPSEKATVVSPAAQVAAEHGNGFASPSTIVILPESTDESSRKDCNIKVENGLATGERPADPDVLMATDASIVPVIPQPHTISSPSVNIINLPKTNMARSVSAGNHSVIATSPTAAAAAQESFIDNTTATATFVGPVEQTETISNSTMPSTVIIL